MKRYEGMLQAGTFPGVVIFTENVDGVRWRKPLKYRLDLSNHSPDGFAWGFGGSGPAQLALALLADATGDDDLAICMHQQFKFAKIAALDKSANWTMTDAEIKAWVDAETKDKRP